MGVEVEVAVDVLEEEVDAMAAAFTDANRPAAAKRSLILHAIV
jgi:hypothetical protein